MLAESIATRLQQIATYEGGQFLNGDVARMPAADKAAVDAHLVSIAHPMAYEPGTQESRIVRYARELVR